MARAAAVELQRVTKRFGDFVAVDRVSLTIEEGEFFSLLGPSGCGKTTNLRMIAGFELPTEGDIYLGGESVGRLPPFKRNVNTVFQNYALFPHLSAEENVAFGLQMKKVPAPEINQRVREALELVRLPNVGGSRPHQLSGGQQQRVALARALVNRPKVLLLDEPLGALDLKLRKAMQLELKALQRQLGITFIFVTHDQEEALVMSDRIGVMSEGRLLQVGAPKDIYDRPANRFVADFIGETNFLNCRVLDYQDGLATIRLADQLVTKAATLEAPTTGQEATLAIRPEKIHLHLLDEANLQEETVFPGRIHDTTFIGTDTRFVVTLAPGVQLDVRYQNVNPGEVAFAVGEAVAVSWQPSSARLLTA